MACGYPDNPISHEEQNGLDKALDYLKILAFSRSGLMSILQYEGFSLNPRRILLITAVLIGIRTSCQKSSELTGNIVNSEASVV